MILEAGRRVGGNIRTDHIDGFTIERGPNGYLDDVPAMARLVERLDLGSELQRAAKRASKRFLYRNHELHLLPTGPLGLLSSSVLSVRGRLRVFLEPFARSKPDGIDETIYEFASRRIGSEAAEVLIDAMVSGVFAGDTRKLSLASAFPRIAAMEEVHGSLVWAMVSRMRERRTAKRQARELAQRGDESIEEMTCPGGPAGPRGTLTSFKQGLDVLVEGLVAELREAIRLDSGVTAIEPSLTGMSVGAGGQSSAGVPQWRIVTAAGEMIQADAVLVAAPSPRAAPLLKEIDRTLGEMLDAIPSAGLAVVALSFEAAAVGGPPDGFGFLVPRSEGLRILGCLWDSCIFPGRAPDDKVLLRVMIGGAHDPQAVELEDATLISVVRQDLATAMSLTAEPSLIRVYRHRLGIAQYERGHQDRMDIIAERLGKLPGLWVAGSSFFGVSMNACVEEGSNLWPRLTRDSASAN